MIANAFTCTGPYALLIMLGIKRVENRGAAPEPRKGRCAISCSKSFCKEEYGNFVQWASQTLSEEDFDLIPAWSDVKDWPGKIVGACSYSTRSRADLVLESASRSGACAKGESCLRSGAAISWDEGYPYWWDLSEVISFDLPIPCRGNVGMWRLPEDLRRRVATADVLARSVGTKISTADDARRIFDAIVVAHNHPSGDPTPSAQDRQLTAELTRMGEALEVKVLDHLVLT